MRSRWKKDANEDSGSDNDVGEEVAAVVLEPLHDESEEEGGEERRCLIFRAVRGVEGE